MEDKDRRSVGVRDMHRRFGWYNKGCGRVGRRIRSGQLDLRSENDTLG